MGKRKNKWDSEQIIVMLRKGDISIGVILAITTGVILATSVIGGSLSFLDTSENETDVLNQTLENNTESTRCSLKCTKQHPSGGAQYQGCISNCGS